MQSLILLLLKYFFRFIKRLFNQDILVLSNILPIFLVIAVIFYQFTEFKYSNLITAVNEVSSNYIKIDPYSRILLNNSFVYMITNGIVYPALSDNEFNIQTHAAIIKRSVDYCQWLEEGFDSTDKITRTRRYMKVWVKEIINSSEFMDLRYNNPSYKFSFSDSYIYADSFPIGNYIIDSNIFKKNKNNLVPFELDNNQSITLKNFNSSFKYIGNGQFYYYYNKSSNNLIPPHKNNDDCTPGDIRVTILQYSPHTASIAGLLNSTTRVINTTTINNTEIGAFEAGNMEIKNLLIIRYKKLISFVMIARFLMFIVILINILLRSTSQVETIQKLVISSVTVLFAKYLIWRGEFLFCFSFSISYLLFLFYNY